MRAKILVVLLALALTAPAVFSRGTQTGSGLDGIANAVDPGEPNAENLYAIPYDELKGRGLETLPANLLEATHELKTNEVIRKALGRGRDEDYADYFIRVKREEWDRYHEQVSPWEVTEYLTRF